MPAQTRSLVYSRAAKNVQQSYKSAESFFQTDFVSLILYKPGHFWPGEICAVPGTEIENWPSRYLPPLP